MTTSMLSATILPLSATILRHPQLFSAIRNYFPLSATIFPPSATILRHPQLFSAIRNYFLTNTISFKIKLMVKEEWIWNYLRGI